MSEIDPRMFGWRHDRAEEAYRGIKAELTPFGELKLAEPNEYRPIWDYVERLNDGRHLPTRRQETGDCVSWGARHALIYHHAYEVEHRGEEEAWRIPFAPYLYATSRTKPDCGNGQLGRSAGSTGAWAITAMKRYGVLFEDDAGVPAYSGRIADDWGYRGAPAQFEQLAADNPIRWASKLQSADEVRACLRAQKLITYAVMWDYGTGATTHQGYRVMRRGGGGGGHQVCLIAWMDEPFEAAFCLNSWGETVHAGPDNGEPVGGAWIRKADLTRDLTARFTEVYALDLFLGHQATPDFGGL